MPARTANPTKPRKTERAPITPQTAPPRAKAPEVTEPSPLPLPENSIGDHRVLPSHEAVAARAFAISEERRRAGIEGDEMSDWLRAEQELLEASNGTQP